MLIWAWQVNDTFTLIRLIKLSRSPLRDQGFIQGDGIRINLCGGKDHSSQASFKMAGNLMLNEYSVLHIAGHSQINSGTEKDFLLLLGDGSHLDWAKSCRVITFHDDTSLQKNVCSYNSNVMSSSRAG